MIGHVTREDGASVGVGPAPYRIALLISPDLVLPLAHQALGVLDLGTAIRDEIERRQARGRVDILVRVADHWTGHRAFLVTSPEVTA